MEVDRRRLDPEQALDRNTMVIEEGIISLPITVASGARGRHFDVLRRDAAWVLRNLVERERVGEALAFARRWRAAGVGGLMAMAQVDADIDTADTGWVQAQSQMRDLRRRYHALRDEFASSSSAGRAALQERIKELVREEGIELEAATNERWSLPPSRSPDPGELMVVLIPWVLDDDPVWRLLTLDARGVTAGPTVSEAVLRSGAGFWDALDEPIARAERVTLLVPVELNSLDLHLAPWRGQPLLATHEVVWGVDWMRPRSYSATDRVVVAADPDGSLPSARKEGEAVRRALGGDGVLLTDSAARDVLAALEQPVDVFHFAGHGDRMGVAGALRFARETEASATDVLSLPSVPRIVVLQACGSAAAGRPAFGGFSLAEAFVLAGAEVALGSKDRLNDDSALRFSTLLYERGLRDDAVGAWREAVLAMGDEAAQFRIYVP
jgi:hypothetical protein